MSETGGRSIIEPALAGSAAPTRQPFRRAHRRGRGRHGSRRPISRPNEILMVDAFFFTTVQLLTVSSQIKNPLTVAGQVLDVFLELWAVLVVAGSAGAIASFFHSGDSE